MVFRSSRRFLEEYLRQAYLCTQHGFQWFLPGFIHPLQAMIVLLLHLTGCTNLQHEASLQSKRLLIEIFELFGNRLEQGRVVSSNADVAKSQDRSDKVHLIYCLLAKLRNRVWDRAGWADLGGGSTCPMRNLAEAIDFARSEELLKQSNEHTEVPDDSLQAFHLDDIMSIESTDQIDWSQYDDLIEQFLQPGI